MVLGLHRVLDEWLTCTTGVRLKLKLLAFYDTTSEMQTQGPPARKLLCTFSNAEICEAETVNAAGEKVKWVWFVVEHQLEEDEKGRERPWSIVAFPIGGAEKVEEFIARQIGLVEAGGRGESGKCTLCAEFSLFAEYILSCLLFYSAPSSFRPLFLPALFRSLSDFIWLFL